MDVAIVYESIYGNTCQIAEAIAAGVRASDPEARVALLPVAEATLAKLGEPDLLVVGGPTHALRMTTRDTRGTARQMADEPAKEGAVPPTVEPAAAGPGIRDWLGELTRPQPGSSAAAFDTRFSFPLAGSAARGIARRLRRRGYDIATRPKSFIVQGTTGPLRDGELERARAWGAALSPRSVRFTPH